MIIKLYSNRKVEPSSIIMANQHENMTRVLEFNLERVPNGYRYLVLTNSSGSNLYLITDNKVDITSAFTWNGQTYEANVVVSNIELENELVSTNVLWISNTFRLQVRRNNINAEELSKLPIPPDLQMPYDKLLQLIEDVEGKLENGEFNGEDGVGIKSIEKTGSEGLVDTYTITLTDDSTFVYSVINGRDGIDGKSAYELAVENGFKGTEQEWLASLDYEHSEEFEQLAEQVKNDAKKSASNASTASAAAQSAATNAGAALNSANAASQSAADASVSATQAQQAAQEAENSKTSAETASSNAQQSARSAEENANKAQEIADSLDPTIFAIKETTTGNPTIISDSADWRLQKLSIYGQSEQDSTTGSQLLDPSLYEEDKFTNGITYITNEDGSVKIEGTATSSANKYLGEYIDIFEHGQIYTCNLSQNGYTGGFNITYNDDRHDYLPTLTVDRSTMISIRPYIQVITNVTKNETIYPMVNKGSSVLPWEPYTGGKPSPSPDYQQEIISEEVSEIKLYGTNLFDLEKEKMVPNTNWDEKRQCFHPKAVAYYISMVINEVWDIAHKSGSVLTISFDIKSDKNGKVKVYSLGNRGLKVVAGETDVVDATKEYVRKYVHFRTLDKIGKPDLTGQGDNCGLSFYGVVEGKSVIPEIKNICISITENTEYIPYKSQTITLTEPVTLRGVTVASDGNVTIDEQQYISDVIIEKDGVIGVEGNAKELIFDGSEDENWILSPVAESIYRYRIELSDAKRFAGLNGTLLCNRGFYISDNDVGSCFMYLYTKSISNPSFYFIPEQSIESAEQFKEYLATNNLKLVYLLETPTFEPLPEEIQTQYKALKSYYPNTVIQTGCWNEVEYVADTKTWIENKLNGVTELALGGK